MKKGSWLIAIVVCLFAATAGATNTVSVTGDPNRDGKLLIDLHWTVDTAKYPGLPIDSVREKMYEKMWEKTLPELVKSTKGYPISYDDSNFTYLEEHSKLVSTRPDGSKVYAVDLKMQFNCRRAPASPAKAQGSSERTKDMNEQLRYRFVKQY